MTTKTKTKPKARARTAPAEVQPVANPAPEPAPAMVVAEPVGMRTPDAWNRRDKNPRPVGALTRTATLVRGISYTISYSNGPLVFKKGEAVPITDNEFERLEKAVDKIDFPDGSGARIIRFIRKLVFHSIDSGDLIELEPMPDIEAGAYSLSLADRAALERLHEGEEHTAR